MKKIVYFSILLLSFLPMAFLFAKHGDKIPPVILNISAEDIAQTSVVIHWETDEETTGTIQYGQTEDYTDKIDEDNLGTIHSVEISGLLSGTHYHFRITAEDEDKNKTRSDDQSFETLPEVDESFPNFSSDISVSKTNDSSVSISFTTDIEAIVHIDYGLTSGYGTVFENDSPATNHNINIDGLSSPNTYHFRITVSNAFGGTISEDISFFLESDSGNGGGGGGDDEEIPEDGGTHHVHVEEVTTEEHSVATTSIQTNIVSNVRAGALDSEIHIFWKNPETENFGNVLIVRKDGSYPTNSKDGLVVYDGTGQTFVDKNVVNARTYYYKIFTIGKDLVESIPVEFSISPRGGIHRLHFITKSTTSGHSILLTKDYKLNDSGHDITHIQELLAIDPTIYPRGLTTGFFGPLTQAAVFRFQEKNGLTINGVVDAPTREKLMELSRTQFIDQSPFEVGVVSFSQNLSYGMKNNNVRYLQEFLILEGLFPSDLVSGLFGPITKTAVVNFQNKYSISPALGYVGELTRAQIVKLLNK